MAKRYVVTIKGKCGKHIPYYPASKKNTPNPPTKKSPHTQFPDSIEAIYPVPRPCRGGARGGVSNIPFKHTATIKGTRIGDCDIKLITARISRQ